jgi:hypothetical protein
MVFSNAAQSPSHNEPPETVSMSPGLAYAMRCIDDRVFQIAGDMRLLQQLT